MALRFTWQNYTLIKELKKGGEKAVGDADQGRGGQVDAGGRHSFVWDTMVIQTIET